MTNQEIENKLKNSFEKKVLISINIEEVEDGFVIYEAVMEKGFVIIPFLNQRLISFENKKDFNCLQFIADIEELKTL